MLKNILSQWYKYVVWALISLFFWSWIISLRSDAPADRKLVLCVDAPGYTGETLREALPDELPDGVEQLAVHGFDYYVFEQDELLEADLYLVPAAHAPSYIDSFLPLDEAGFAPGGHAVWEHEGRALGIVLDGAAFGLPGGEDWLLCFGSQGAHQTDGAALWLAEKLLALP